MAFSLRTLGEVGARVESPRGTHMVKFAAREPALEQPFEAVKARIQNRLGAGRRSKAVVTLIAKLREQTPVEFDDSLLETLDVRDLSVDGQAH